ncbi:hypothetical protein L1987_64077 [Smallanthus sonchifolius]|uniref:Uncharacterized protein n=1 Tax=Smallanthus sonchifolius TaxID=185202 RepID=A0ACB9CFF2_9ASTR|nr:hypothetical protein L1987_64077 [Smallanthus sonchifolius]
MRLCPVAAGAGYGGISRLRRMLVVLLPACWMVRVECNGVGTGSSEIERVTEQRLELILTLSMARSGKCVSQGYGLLMRVVLRAARKESCRTSNAYDLSCEKYVILGLCVRLMMSSGSDEGNPDDGAVTSVTCRGYRCKRSVDVSWLEGGVTRIGVQAFVRMPGLGPYKLVSEPWFKRKSVFLLK